MFDLERAIGSWRQKFKSRRAFMGGDLDELEGHLRDHIEALTASGVPEREAFQQAIWRLGDSGSIEESYRQIYWKKVKAKDSFWHTVLREASMLGDYVRQDITYTLRTLFKKPVYTIVAILAIAIGIGMNTAIFSVVNGVLLEPLPYENPDRIVRIWETNLSKGWDQFSVSPANYRDWQEQNTIFEGLAVFQGLPVTLTGGEQPERLLSARISANLFEVMGIEPIRGRTFALEEEQLGSHQVTILSHAFWQRRFGGDADIVGSTMQLDGVSYTVVGIMPDGFTFPFEAAVWTPLALSDQARQNRGGHFINVVARLKEGVSLEEAQTELQTIAARLEAEYPDTNTGWSTTMKLLQEVIVGDIRPSLIMLLGAVICVLLIACANVANLLLARAATRTKEMAIRTAVGAGRSRLVRQLLTEHIILACIGGVVGLILAYWGIDILKALSPSNVPRLDEIAIDSRVLGFTLFLTLIAGIIVGLFPALQASTPDQTDSLKEGGRRSTAGGRTMVRHILVGFEVAISLVLLICAGLLIRSFEQVQGVDPGFDAENVLTVGVTLPEATYGDFRDTNRQAAFLRQGTERLSALPGVQAVSAAAPVPFTWDTIYGFIKEKNPPEPSQVPSANHYRVGAGYFESMGVTLLKGRSFTEQDNEQAQRVAVINETMAKRFFPDEDPIGQRIHITYGPRTWREIVGVVRDMKHYGLDSDQPIPQMYEPLYQTPSRFLTFVLKIETDPSTLGAAARREIQAIDRNLPVTIMPMSQRLENSVAQRRFSMLLLSIFATVALVLAALGVFGVISYTVSQRTHEIGVRMALGAKPADVLKMAIGQGMTPILIGLGVGLVGAFMLTHLLSSLLFEITTTDPMTFVSVTLFLAVIALIACYLPARRAMRVDPMVALRYEG